MQEVREIPNEILIGKENSDSGTTAAWRNYLPAILAVGGAFLMLFGRIEIGANFISDGALMMLALACYIFAALFQLTNLYAPSAMAQKIGLWTRNARRFFQFGELAGALGRRV